MKAYQKNWIIIFIFLSILSSCIKENNVNPLTNNSKNVLTTPDITPQALVSMPQGIVYIPLNIILQGNTNVYSYVWSKSVDLDNDAAMDFDFKMALAWSRGADFYHITHTITALNNGGGTLSTRLTTALTSMPYTGTSNPLPAGTLIGPNTQEYLSPSAASTYLYSRYFGGTKGGTIIGKGDKYIGVRFVSNGQTYYGWFRINISANGRTFTIKDAAFNNLPNTAISAGAIK